MSVDLLANRWPKVAALLTSALLADRKIIACGNGPDAALAQLFASKLLDRFEQERPALPALALAADAASLTAIAHQEGIEEIYSRQIGPWARPATSCSASRVLWRRRASSERCRQHTNGTWP